MKKSIFNKRNAKNVSQNYLTLYYKVCDTCQAWIRIQYITNADFTVQVLSVACVHGEIDMFIKGRSREQQILLNVFLVNTLILNCLF